ncbi:hypothetical protein KRX54_02905 [Actinomycetaceae bacterium TAE3-ERU4]|nr:hypothetical protein [Actinomycetaceae bacterium TAE3-ERU4]
MKRFLTAGLVLPGLLFLTACEAKTEVTVHANKTVATTLNLNTGELDQAFKQQGIKSCDDLLTQVKAFSGSSKEIDELFDKVEQTGDNPLTCTFLGKEKTLSNEEIKFEKDKILFDLSKPFSDFSRQISGKVAALPPNIFKISLTVVMPTKITSATGAEISDKKATWPDLLHLKEGDGRIEAQPLPGGSGSSSFIKRILIGAGSGGLIAAIAAFFATRKKNKKDNMQTAEQQGANPYAGQSAQGNNPYQHQPNQPYHQQGGQPAHTYGEQPQQAPGYQTGAQGTTQAHTQPQSFGQPGQQEYPQDSSPSTDNPWAPPSNS